MSAYARGSGRHVGASYVIDALAVLQMAALPGLNARPDAGGSEMDAACMTDLSSYPRVLTSTPFGV